MNLSDLVKKCSDIAKRNGWALHCSVHVEQSTSHKGELHTPEYRVFVHPHFASKEKMFASKTLDSPKAVIHALEVHFKTYGKKFKHEELGLTNINK